jgi:hypothetical protein
MNEHWLTVKEFAALFRVHIQTVYTAIRYGRLRYPIRRLTPGGRIEIQVSGYNAPPALNLCGVYFWECGSYVKIGMSSDVQKRLQQLSQTIPYPLKPLGFIPAETVNAALEIEKAWHHRFSPNRHRPEWFRATPELVNAIAGESQPWPVSRESIKTLSA